MPQKQLLLPLEDVHKHNQLIQNRVNLPSVIGQRILATLIVNIDRHQADEALSVKIPVNKLMSSSGGNDYESIKVACSEMAKATVELEILGKNGKENDLFFYPFFSYIQYKDGNIYAKFNPELKSLILFIFEEGFFTQYNLLEFYMLKSYYSQRLYEILKSYSFVKDGFKVFELEELHNLLHSPESLRNNFAEFKRRVLEPVFKEITKKTLFRYEYEVVKKGTGKTSPVIGVRFIFAKSKALELYKKRELEAQALSSKKQADIFLKAIECAKRKLGVCLEQDNSETGVCEMCHRFKIFDDIKTKI